MVSTSPHRAVIALGLTALIVGCSSAPKLDDPVADTPFALNEDYATGMLEYTVQPGDLLGDIALEFTGSLQNWRAIADTNGIRDPRTLRPGTTLQIPMQLIPGYDPDQPRESLAAARAAMTEREQAVTASEAASADQRDAAAGQTDGSTSRNTAGAEEQTDNAQAESTVSVASPETETTEVTVAAVPDVPPSAERLADSDNPAANATRSVEVSGSYYPRGVYAEPSGAATLIMRVAPGTLMPLERTIDNWYRVTTTEGTGYIRSSDARIVESSRRPASTASGD